MSPNRVSPAPTCPISSSHQDSQTDRKVKTGRHRSMFVIATNGQKHKLRCIRSSGLSSNGFGGELLEAYRKLKRLWRFWGPKA
ncbi:hypothetical protein CI238_06220 [Colletotrichum incanum]|uniref:Uncharacterized protein n=1 Tax=Colletotrichum incanum TaxID=1573173 RepID=A0A166NTW0_COLIC|nr:hypothetical protein CI238_06220 [Colletotrichum incanum]